MSADPLTHLTADTIAGVIGSLDRIVAWAKAHASPLGYFAALYRKVTVQVARGIEQGRFEDGARMERLDVVFANRYLAALERHRSRGELSRAWSTAFGALDRWSPIVLQHLMVGMNAHINLDLGVAAAEVGDPSRLPELRHDFFAINDILASLVDEVQLELAGIWPLMRLIDLAAGRGDEAIANLGMLVTRNRAWAVAERLAALPRAEWTAEIDRLDGSVAALGDRLLHPRPLLRATFWLIRLGELRSVPRVIEVLE